MAGNVRENKKNVAVEALLSSPSVRAAAEKAGVSERTLFRWLRDSAFQERLQEARRDVFQHGAGRLIGLLNKAVDVVQIALERKIGKGRFLAARLVIESALGIQDNDLQCRVSGLERRFRERRQKSQYGSWDQQIEANLQSRKQKLQELSADELRDQLRQKASNDDSNNP